MRAGSVRGVMKDGAGDVRFEVLAVSGLGVGYGGFLHCVLWSV